MKIKLKMDIPIEAIHGMTEGRILDGEVRREGRGRNGWWVDGDVGERVFIKSDEAEVVE